MANNNNQISTFLFSLDCLCAGDTNLEQKVKLVRDEFNNYATVDSDVKDPRNRRLNKLLRASRAMETSMEDFLLKNNNCPADMRKHTMGGFIDALLRPQTGCTHSALPQPTYAKGSGNSNSIRNRRNTYLHQAGVYPLPLDVKKFNEDVIEFLSVMIAL